MLHVSCCTFVLLLKVATEIRHLCNAVEWSKAQRALACYALAT